MTFLSLLPPLVVLVLFGCVTLSTTTTTTTTTTKTTTTTTTTTTTSGDPQQVHISLTGKKGEVVIQWVTFSPPLSPHVLCGKNSSSLSWCADASTNHYPEITGWEGFIHTAVVQNLTARQLYYYQVGDSDGSFSDIFTFKGPRYPVCGASDQEINLAVFGDMDINVKSDKTVYHLTQTRDNYDFFLHMGDIAYTSMSNTLQVNDTRLDDFFLKIEPLAAFVPYLVSPGNQEQYYRFWQHEHRWYTPPGPNGVKNLWYSFDYGCAHFISISTEHDLSPESQQYKWLENDLMLANQQRDDVPFVIVYGHRPLYCTNSPLHSGYFEDCYLTGPAMRDNIEKLLTKYTVDLFMSGHMHDAEIMYPLKNTKVQQTNWIDPPADSITQVISGYAGCREHHNGFDDNFTKPWTAFRDASHYGYSTLNIKNSTYLEMNYYFNDDNDSVFDLVFTRGENRQGGVGEGKEEEEEWGLDEPLIPEDVLASLPFSPTFLFERLNNINNNNQYDDVSFLFSLPSDLTSFGIGFFLGLGNIFGNIHSDVANWEIGITYDIFWLKLLWEQYFEQPTQQNKENAWKMTDLFLFDLKNLVEESGGPEGVYDLAALIVFEKKNGLDALIALETAKFAKHERDIRHWLQNAQIFLENDQPEQAGVEYGQVLGVLLKPLI